MSRDNPPDHDDLELFRSAVAEVRPLAQDKIEPPVRRARPIPRQTLADEEQVLRDMLSDEFDPADVETGEHLLFSRPGVQHRTLRKLRRGQFSVSAELDLHGMNVPMARQALAQFLLHSRGHNQCCVRIIHGKGNRSAHRGPVLKNMVNKWLQQRDEVLAYCSALPVDGGTGAVYVLLKRG
jgi:DNA-nicking Smr family endonuclease